MSVKVEGLAETIQALYAKEKTLEGKIDIAIRSGAVDVVESAKKPMAQGTHGGKVYVRTDKNGNKTYHKSSAPGEAPAVDRGRLIASIAAVKSIYGDGWLVGTSLDYGKHLEFGTKNMESRPWLIPALEKNRKAIYTSIQKAIKASL